MGSIWSCNWDDFACVKPLPFLEFASNDNLSIMAPNFPGRLVYVAWDNINEECKGFNSRNVSLTIYIEHQSLYESEKLGIGVTLRQVCQRVCHRFVIMEHNTGHAKEELGNLLVKLASALEFFSKLISRHARMILIESQA